MIRRSRTGCMSCKYRRKKCDERKPICLGCKRNSLACSYAKSTPPSPKIPKQKPVKRLKTIVSDTRSLDLVSSDGVIEGKDEHADFEQQQSSAAASALVSTVNMRIMPSSIMLRLPISEDCFSGSSSRLLLGHFVKETANTLSSLTGTNNPFITLLMPIALSNSSVLHAILALSGIHYADRVSPLLGSTTWTHYSEAIRSVRDGITDLGSQNQSDLMPILLTTLILCFIENARGDISGSVFHHLKAAKHLLGAYFMLPSTILSPDLRGFIAEFYTYLAVLADISTDNEQQDVASDGLTLFSNEISRHRGSGMLYGCAQELFQMIPHISKLSKKRLKDETNFGRCSVENLNAYFQLRDEIIQWKPPGEETETSHILCGLLYQQALLVYLETSIRKFELSSPESTMFIENALEEFVRLLMSLPVESAISTTLCWPIVVLGSWATSTRHRKIIASRLEIMSESLGMGCLRQSRRFLEIIWTRENLYADGSGLQRIMKSHNLKIVFA